MTTKGLSIDETNILEKQWVKIYFIGGLAAILSFAGTLADIIAGSVLGSNLSEVPHTAVQKFVEFHQNWLLGLYHLDLLNVVTALIMIPAYFALCGLHRKSNFPYAATAMMFSFLGTIIFVSTNTALPMFELSNKYLSISDETQKMLIAAAGEAMLARGEHGSLGVFIGFIFITIGSLGMSIVILNGGFFKKIVSYLGIMGNALLLIYILLVTFVPAVKNIAVIIAAPGGLMALVWMLMIGVKLIKVGRETI